MRATLLALLLIPSIGLAQADARATELRARRLALVSLGVPADDPALVQGEHAEAACALGQAARCAIAEAAYALAAARIAHAELLASFAALGLTPPPAPHEAPGTGDSAARLRRAREQLEARILVLRRALEAHAVPVDREAARSQAARMAAEQAARSESDDDAYRARRARASDRTTMRRQAVAALERSLPRRIGALTDPSSQAHAREALSRALAIEDVDARLSALLEVDAMLLAASRTRR